MIIGASWDSLGPRVDLLSVDTALDRVLSDVVALPGERIALEMAGGRVLAEAVGARRQQPPFNASAMDGYALRADDSAPGTRLRIVGEAKAGARYQATLRRSETVRIYTGAPIPEGADTVLLQEEAVIQGGELLIAQPLEPFRHLRRVGSDFGIGDLLLEAGRRLGPRELAAAAAANHDTVSVRRTPRVAVLSIGDELVAPGSEPGIDQIVATNAFAITEMAREAGADAYDVGIIGDRVESVTDIAKHEAARSDVLVTIGGASVGGYDVVRESLAKAGMDLRFSGVAIRPGKPLAFGRLGSTGIIALPGNPVASFVGAHIFLRPLIWALLGLTRSDPHDAAILASALPANGPRTAYLRATLEESPNGLPVVHAISRQDSSFISVLVEADCLLVRPPNAQASKTGEVCRIIRL